jgi:hypothetical protein
MLNYYWEKEKKSRFFSLHNGFVSAFMQAKKKRKKTKRIEREKDKL